MRIKKITTQLYDNRDRNLLGKEFAILYYTSKYASCDDRTPQSNKLTSLTALHCDTDGKWAFTLVPENKRLDEYITIEV